MIKKDPRKPDDEDAVPDQDSTEEDEQKRVRRFIWTEDDFEILPPSEDEASN